MDFDEFNKWKDKARWEKFELHFNNNSVYRDFINSHSFRKPILWNEIPVLSKSWLQRPLKEIVTSGMHPKDLYFSNTSGSSGQPFYFIKDKFCHAMTWAVVFDRYNLHKIRYGNSLQARFYGIPLDFTQNISERLKDLISARRRFVVFDLSNPALEVFIQKFSTTKFEYINGYTSSLFVFAKYLVMKGLILKDICPSLKVAIATSEVLSDTDRSLLSKGFGVPVINEYGASELDIIAFEDQDHDWIINDENLWVEIVDEQGRILPDGEEGRIVITSLHNKAMPFIRYEIGDIGSIDINRKGNHHILKTLQGRTNDIILLPSGKKSPGFTFYYVSKKILEEGIPIKEFIIKQKSLNHFHFVYVADGELSDVTIGKIMKTMDDYLEPDLSVTFERQPKIERTEAGKLMHFQREF